MVQLQDYDGPLHKVVGTFTRKLDRRSVRDPHYKPGVVLCSLEIKDKLFLFLRDAVDPETFLASAFDGGISQARNDDPSFGQGSEGYGKRVGVSYIDQTQYRFFKEFAYPTIFGEDPRYYRLGQGSVRGDSCTPWLMPWWPTTTMASRCSIIRSGWAKPAAR